MSVPPRAPPKPSEPLYDAVALGMWLYTRTRFRVEMLRPERFRLDPGCLLVASHREETDVPLVCPSIYLAAGYRRARRGGWLPNFAARDDMFEAGFFAGFPGRMSPAVRRLLYPISIGPFLPLVRVNPVPYPGVATLRLGRALAAVPADLHLADVLPVEILRRLEARARELGVPAPRTAGEVLDGAYADLLWHFCSRDELPSSDFKRAWDARTQEGARAVRHLIELVRAREILLLFPEGRPSPDGTIGPIRRGLRTIVRQGRPAAIEPIAFAYDPLTTGRTRAYVAFHAELSPPFDEIEDRILDVLRLTTPLTTGQVVAYELIARAAGGEEEIAASDLAAALARARERSAAEDRPVERALESPDGRRSRLGEALAWVERSGLGARRAAGRLRCSPERVLSDRALGRLAREFASAHGEPPIV